MKVSNLIFLGTKNRACAFDKASGTKVWQVELSGNWNSTSFVNLLFDGTSLFAHANGELFCLNPESGNILWRNGLEGLGYGLASLACPSSQCQTDAAPIAQNLYQQQSSGAGGAAS